MTFDLPTLSSNFIFCLQILQKIFGTSQQNCLDIMDEIPSRHRKKQRKSNSKNVETDVVPEETSKQFSKRELQSNWNKYDDKTNFDDAPQPPNFEELLLAPASIAGHFLFNSERSWEATDDWYNRDDYFQLNLMELSRSLATIPFYECQNYPKDIFSLDEIEDMNRQAKYQQFKLAANNKNTVDSVGGQCSPIDRKSEINKTETAANLPQNDDDDLDELLNLTGTGKQKFQSSDIPSSSSTVSSVGTHRIGEKITTVDSTDDIQKWLDDVLVLDS